MIPTLVFGLAALFVLFFFRDPVRDIPPDFNAVLAPADGRVLGVEHLLDRDNPLGRPAFKISIFMSLLDVHVNRAPVGGSVTRIRYHPGKFFAAQLDKASAHNENNRITLEVPGSGEEILVIQIAGLIARRISCWVQEGDRLSAGQRIGLIRFGSRVEAFLPDHCEIAARAHQKVKAGLTVMAFMPRSGDEPA